MKNKFLALVLGIGIVGVSSAAVFASTTTSTPNSDKSKTCCTQNAPCCIQKAACCK